MGGCCSKDAAGAADEYVEDEDDVHMPVKQPRISEWNLTALAVEGAAADGESNLAPFTSINEGGDAQFAQADAAAAALSSNADGAKEGDSISGAGPALIAAPA